jgi:hypothetical protein
VVVIEMTGLLWSDGESVIGSLKGSVVPHKG